MFYFLGKITNKDFVMFLFFFINHDILVNVLNEITFRQTSSDIKCSQIMRTFYNYWIIIADFIISQSLSVEIVLMVFSSPGEGKKWVSKFFENDKAQGVTFRDEDKRTWKQYSEWWAQFWGQNWCCIPGQVQSALGEDMAGTGCEAPTP